MKKKNIDPIADIAGASASDEESEKKRIVRIGELEKRLENGESISEEEIFSTYMPARKARILGAALIRMDKLRLALLIGALLIVIMFALSFIQEKTGNFTINLNRSQLYRKGITISADGNFTEPTAKLTADPISDVTNITWTDIPGDVNFTDGSHNGRHYMAYTYYVRNAGEAAVSYDAVISLNGSAKGVEKAMRIAVWRNDELTVYAAPSASGQPEKGTVSFESEKNICRYHVDDFRVGYVDKYCIVIYLEGDDPECVDSLVGGAAEFVMNIDADNDDDSSPFEDFINDIIDIVTGNTGKPGAGAGANATWETRLNK